MPYYILLILFKTFDLNRFFGILYNIAVQQYNDNLNQTFGANASIMWLPMMAVNNTADAAQPIDSYASMKPVHKMDGTQGETTVVQY